MLNTHKHISDMVFVPGVITSSPMKTTEGYFLLSSGNFLVLQKILFNPFLSFILFTFTSHYFKQVSTLIFRVSMTGIVNLDPVESEEIKILQKYICFQVSRGDDYSMKTIPESEAKT